MRKLRTPLQYGYALEELNDLRPLQVDDKVKQVISIPTLNELAYTSKKSAFGRLVKGTQQGGEIIHHNHKLVEYESVFHTISELEYKWFITYTQTVYKVVVKHNYTEACIHLKWTNPTYAKTIQELVLNGVSNCNFVGRIMYFWLLNPIPNTNYIDVYGYY